MIISFTGTPGSGKTYDAVNKILDNLKLGGRTIYTNIRGLDDELCKQAIKDYCGLTDSQLATRLKMIPEEHISEFWNYIDRGSMVVLDEVQNYFGSREWNTEKNKAFGRWASTHRHHGFDVVLITQHIDRLDTSVRNLVEWLYVYKKLNFFGSLIKNQYLCYSWMGSESHGKALNYQRKTYDKKVFLCYQSYAAKDIKEQGIMKHANVLKNWIFYSIPILLIVTVYMFSKSGIKDGDLFGSRKTLEAAEKRKVPAKKPENKPSTSVFPVIDHPYVPPEPVNNFDPFPTWNDNQTWNNTGTTKPIEMDDNIFIVESISCVEHDGKYDAMIKYEGKKYQLNSIYRNYEVECNGEYVDVKDDDEIKYRFVRS